MPVISAVDGYDYPIERIAHIGRARDVDYKTIRAKAKIYSVELIDEQRIDVHSFEVQRYLSRPLSLIPAEPGTYTLHANDGEKVTAFRTRVIAWALCADEEVRPVTGSGINDALTETPPILHPDGTVCVPGDCDYATEAEWLETMQANRTAQLARSLAPEAGNA